MTNEQKARIYDDCLRESDHLQRINSKIKSDHAGNIPADLEKVINSNNNRIAFLVAKLEDLLR